MEDYIRPVLDDFPDILFIEGDQHARYPYSHSLLIKDYLIDTGASSKRLKKVKKQHKINDVILSHWHEDHIHGNRLFKNAQFFCHKNDKAVIENISKMIAYYNVETTSVGEDLQRLLDYLRCESVKITNPIEDGNIINIGEFNLEVLFTPGHTAGHCAFLETRSNIGFLGDIDLSKFPYYGNIDANLMQFEKSLEKLLAIDFEVVVTGHKGPFYGKGLIKEKLINFKNTLKKRDERILNEFKEKKATNIKDLKSKHLIYRKYLFEEFEIIAELIMIQKHIDKFIHMDIMIQNDDGYVLK